MFRLRPDFHAFRWSLTTFSPTKNLQTSFAAPQNPSTNTCLSKSPPDTTSALFRCINLGFDLLLYFSLKKISSAISENRD